MACCKQNNTVENEEYDEDWDPWLADIDEVKKRHYYGYSLSLPDKIAYNVWVCDLVDLPDPRPHDILRFLHCCFVSNIILSLIKNYELLRVHKRVCPATSPVRKMYVCSSEELLKIEYIKLLCLIILQVMETKFNMEINLKLCC